MNAPRWDKNKYKIVAWLALVYVTIVVEETLLYVLHVVKQMRRIVEGYNRLMEVDSKDRDHLNKWGEKGWLRDIEEKRDAMEEEFVNSRDRRDLRWKWKRLNWIVDEVRMIMEREDESMKAAEDYTMDTEENGWMEKRKEEVKQRMKKTIQERIKKRRERRSKTNK